MDIPRTQRYKIFSLPHPPQRKEEKINSIKIRKKKTKTTTTTKKKKKKKKKEMPTFGSLLLVSPPLPLVFSVDVL